MAGFIHGNALSVCVNLHLLIPVDLRERDVVELQCKFGQLEALTLLFLDALRSLPVLARVCRFDLGYSPVVVDDVRSIGGVGADGPASLEGAHDLAPLMVGAPPEVGRLVAVDDDRARTDRGDSAEGARIKRPGIAPIVEGLDADLGVELVDEDRAVDTLTVAVPADNVALLGHPQLVQRTTVVPSGAKGFAHSRVPPHDVQSARSG